MKALDTKEDELVYSKCINKFAQTKNSYLIISTNKNKSVTCSLDHTLFVYNKNKLVEILAKNISRGDTLINSNQTREVVKKITLKKEKIHLIDIETEIKNFFANNLLVHNSSQRFHRITEGLAKEFFRRVAESMKECLFDMPKLKGILIGGPIPTKEEFLEEGQLVTKLKEKVIAIKDLGYTDERGLEDLVELSQSDIAEQELVKEKKELEKFFEILGKYREKATYGEEKTRLALERGAVDTLLISKKLNKAKMQEFESLAENIGANVIIIGNEGTDADQFFNITKGIGAILRFAIE